MTKTLLSLAAIASMSTLSADDANTKAITLEPLQITSTAIETDELRSTDAVEIYTAEDIEKAHVQDVYEFLNQQTSITAIPSYGNPFTQKLDMHGYGIGDGYQNIVITINGRRMNNIDMIPQLLSSIAPSSIESIEIIKSSGIVVGGDGANAGVINIKTKANNEHSITVYGGNYGTVDAAFNLGYSDEKLSVSASGERQKSDGTRTINANGDKDKSELKTGNFDVTYAPIEALELRLGASATRTDVIYGGSMTQAEFDADPSQQGTSSGFASNESLQSYKSDVYRAGVSYHVNDAISLNLDGYTENKTSDYELPAYAYTNVADYKYDSAKATVDYVSDLLALSVGFDGFKGKRTGATNSTEKNNYAGFMMSEWYFGASTLKAGYRFEKVNYKYNDVASNLEDDHTLHGAELGYNYMLNNEQSLFANYAHSYQAPDIDRFFNFGGTFNGFIEPMKVDSYTLGFNYILPNNKFKISAYYIDLKNEIYYHPDPTYVNAKNTNIDQSHKYGIDIYDKWIINEMWNVSLNYNYVQAIIDEEQEGTDDYAGNTLPGVSEHNAKATVTILPTSNTTFSLTEVYRSAAYAANDFNNDFAQKQKLYLTTNISVTYVQKSYELFAKINNLFSESNGLWIRDDAIYPVNFTATAIAGMKLKF